MNHVNHAQFLPSFAYAQVPPSFACNRNRVIARVIAMALSVASTSLCIAYAQPSPYSFDDLLSSNSCATISFFKKAQLRTKDRYELVPSSLSWVRTGIWDGRKGLRVVDTPFEYLKAIAIDGTIEISGLGKVGALEQPYAIASTQDGGFVVVVYDEMTPNTPQQGSIRFYDRDGKLSSKIPITQELGNPLASVFAMTPMDDGVLAFGWRKVGSENTNDSFEPEFVYFSRDGSSHRIIETEIFEDEGLLELYRRQFPFLAAVKDTGYVLVMAQETWIGKVDLDGGRLVRLPHFPGDFASSPVLQRDHRWLGRPSSSIHQLFQFYDTIQHSRMPVGIIPWGERLFVLAKEAMEKNGKTLWHVIEIDPEDGSEQARSILPTSAQDIVLVPGDLWGVIQKGPIEVIGSYPADHLFRETASMVVFPGKLLDRDRIVLKEESPLACDRWDS